jgi:hypothetical protein
MYSCDEREIGGGILEERGWDECIMTIFLK